MSSSALAASDHLSKVNAFVSTAGNFIDSALDQLDDQLESAMGGMSEKVGEELKEYSLTAEAMETAKAASSAWSSLGFAALRDEWRDAATEISAKQKDAKSAGRDLAEAARASRREGAGDAENKALLKAMGSEIKRLNERVNLAETAFFSMLNDLDEAPDPSEPLARTTKAAEYVTGAGALRNDLDATKAELAAVKDAALSGANSEAARELRELKEAISAKVDAAVKERTADVDKQTAEMEIAHETMRAQRDSLERTLSELRSRHDATQSELFELREGKFVETTVRDTGERESLAAEAETARVREAEARSEAQRLTHEVARLRERLRDGATNGGLGLGLATDVASTGSSLTAAEMDMDVAALRERLRLRDQVVELLKRDLATRDEANEGELSRLEDIGEGLRRSIADGEARIAALARELETRPTDQTVASLEAQVRTLQALVDSRDLGEEGVPGGADVDADVEGRGAHLGGGGVPTTSSDADPLNAALRRNRRLADELAAAKRDAENAYAKLDASANEATEAQKAVEERDATIKQMEQHLIAATASTAVSSATSPGSNPSTPGAAGLNADLLPVVIGQRDRYKRKVGELEHRVGALEVDLDGEKVRAKRVDADNVSLFEKVRYLQAYYAERAPKTPAPSLELGGSHLAGGVDVSRSERWRRAARYGCGFDVRGGRSNGASGVDPEMLPGGDADGAVGRYDEHHRANHDPYARFQEREAQMSEQRLRLHDRVALRGARAVMRSRVTRTVVVVYLGLMHLYLLYNTAVGCPAPVKT
jgi:homeobox protein cut-like